MTHPGRDRLACCFRLLSSRQRCFVLSLCLASGVALSGCATTDAIQANKLPQYMQAPTIENPKTLDLSKLANGDYGNDAIDSGDVLEVAINVGLSARDNVTIPVTVAKNGAISLPDVGEVPVQGLELESAGSAIAAACVQRRIYRNPNVTVTMKRQQTNRVMVVGAVKTPGTYRLPRRSSDLLSALVAAGSLSDDAGTGIEIRNLNGVDNAVQPDRIANGLGGPNSVFQTGYSQTLPTAARSSQTLKVDLVAATKGGAKAYPLSDGSIVMVERRDPEPVHVLGLVQKPGKFDYPIGSELHLLDAIANAGGVSNLGANKVYIIRKLAGQPQPTMIEASIRDAKRTGANNLKLAPGDVVSVEQTPTTVLVDTLHMLRFAVSTSTSTFF